MKQHAPIKRHEALTAFSKDHHFGLLLVWKIRQGLNKSVDTERISNYVLYFFDEDLQHHFVEEEKLLFNKLAPNDALCQQAQKEHTLLAAYVEKLRSDRSNEKLLVQFGELLEHHIRFEERVLFNYLQNKLTESDLQFVEASHQNHSDIIESGWNDVFWVLEKSGL